MIAWKIEGCGPHYPTNSPPRLTPQGAQYGSSNKKVHCEAATIRGFHMTSQNSNKETIDSSEFYFHEVLQHLKILIYTNFWFQRVFRFAIEDASRNFQTFA